MTEDTGAHRGGANGGADGGAWPPRRLTRRGDGRVVAGVAGGLAAHLGLGPGRVRAAFLLLTPFGGTGVALYAIGWAVIPAPDAPESVAESAARRLGRAPVGAQVAAAVLAVLVLVSVVGGAGPNLGWGLALIGLGFLLFRQDTAASLPRPAPPGDQPTATPAWSTPAWPTPSPLATTWPAPDWPTSPAPRRPRSLLGRTTIAAALLAGGVAAVLDRVGAVTVDAAGHVALALTVVGLGLVVGAWAGRARGLVLVGLALLPALVVASLPPLSVAGHVGERAFRPGTLAEVDGEYELGVGRLLVDLSDVRFGGEPTRVAARVGVGELDVVVPAGTAVTVEGELRAGETHLFGDDATVDPDDLGEPTAFSASSEGTEGGGRLTLDLDAELGAVTVRRATR